MADDRVHIRCDKCGAWKMLLKLHGTHLSTRDNEILSWLDAHGQCRVQDITGVDLSGNPGFSLHTDSDIGGSLNPERQNALPLNNPPSEDSHD